MKIKELLINKTKREIEAKKKSLNYLNDEAKAAAQEMIDDLNAYITELEALEEEKTAEDILKGFEEKVNEKIEALAEKIAEGANPNVPTENYLKSKNAMTDFLKCWTESRDAKEMRANWAAVCSKNNITTSVGSEEALLPEAVRGAIIDAWESPKNWLNRLKWSGAKRYMVRTEVTADSSENVRAKGHKPGETKQNQALEISIKDVTCQMVYKMINIDRLTEFNNPGDLLNYIQGELIRQWIKEVERAVLVGDGRTSATPDLRITSIEKVAGTTTTPYMTAVQYDSNKSLIEQFVDMVAKVDDGIGDIVVFMSKATLNELRKVSFSSTGTPQYLSKEDVAAQIGAADIITTGLIDDATYRGVALATDGYVMVGEMNPELVSQHDITTNVTYYRAENPIGGAIEYPKAAATLYV
jgi:HK97 family phage major capsid protein